MKTLSFELKDKARTESKYKDYKTEKFKEILTDNKSEIEDYFYYLGDSVKSDLSYNSLRWDYLKLDQKSHIRMFKTTINNITFKLNMDFIGSRETLNDYKKKNFTILFYLEHYETINKIMIEVLNDFVLKYPKKAIVKKLGV